MDDTRWLSAEEQRMWRAFRRMLRELDRAVERQLADLGLSEADFALLVPLSEAPDHRLRARDLGRGSGWDRSRLSHHLRRMERRGLISRHTCETDGRGTYVELTDTGLTAIQGAAPGHVETVRHVLIDQLSPEEIELVRRISERVGAAATAEREAVDCPKAG